MPLPNSVPTPSFPGKLSRRWWILPVWAILALGVLWMGDPKACLNAVISSVESPGSWGPLVFFLIYTGATVLLVPGFPLTFSAGVLFGLVHGTVLVSLASTTSAALAFLIARYLARDAIAFRIRRGVPGLAAFDQAFGPDGWKLVGLIRLSPLFPFSLTNYAFGLTGVSFKHYIGASWAAMLPATVIYTYLGSLAGEGARSKEKSPLEWALSGVGLLATVGATVMVSRAARKALQTNPGSECPLIQKD